MPRQGIPSTREEFDPIVPSFRYEWPPLTGWPEDEDDASEAPDVHGHDGTLGIIVGRSDFTGTDIPTATASGSVAMGRSADATGASSVAIGPEASAAAADSTAVGELATVPSSATGAIAIGLGASANADNAIAIGGTASGTHATGYEGPIAIGSGASASKAGCVAIGVSSVARGGTGNVQANSVAIGRAATAGGTAAFTEQAIAIGDAATASQDDSIAIGTSASSTHAQATAIGMLAVSTFAGQVVTGRDEHITVTPGGLNWKVLARTADYTVEAAGTNAAAKQVMITMDATAGNRNITLPPVVSTEIGRVLIVKKIDSSVNTVTLTADATGTADLIDGAATVVLANQYDVCWIIASALDHWSILQLGSP